MYHESTSYLLSVLSSRTNIIKQLTYQLDPLGDWDLAAFSRHIWRRFHPSCLPDLSPETLELLRTTWLHGTYTRTDVLLPWPSQVAGDGRRGAAKSLYHAAAAFAAQGPENANKRHTASSNIILHNSLIY